MTVLVGFLPTAEGEAAFRAGLEEATRRGESLTLVNSPRSGAPVTASKAARMPAWPVICATCRPIEATSSMSPEPIGYHGSITQSCPKATGTPAAISSGTRVMPRSRGRPPCP